MGTDTMVCRHNAEDVQINPRRWNAEEGYFEHGSAQASSAAGSRSGAVLKVKDNGKEIRSKAVDVEQLFETFVESGSQNTTQEKHIEGRTARQTESRGRNNHVDASPLRKGPVETKRKKEGKDKNKSAKAKQPTPKPGKPQQVSRANQKPPPGTASKFAWSSFQDSPDPDTLPIPDFGSPKETDTHEEEEGTNEDPFYSKEATDQDFLRQSERNHTTLPSGEAGASEAPVADLMGGISITHQEQDNRSYSRDFVTPMNVPQQASISPPTMEALPVQMHRKSENQDNQTHTFRSSVVADKGTSMAGQNKSTGPSSISERESQGEQRQPTSFSFTPMVPASVKRKSSHMNRGRASANKGSQPNVSSAEEVRADRKSNERGDYTQKKYKDEKATVDLKHLLFSAS